jgi:hypothetical protein
MIKFFRKIRKNLLSENKTGKYFKYAIGEIVLVVIGILIALSLNNWNSERINNNRKSELLVKLSKELDLNIERSYFLDTTAFLSFSIRFAYTDSILKILDKGIEKKDFDYLVQNDVFFINTFNLNTSVFEELKNTGSLYSIGSDSLVTEIQRYYQLCNRESFYNLNYSNDINRLKDKCYEGWYDFKYMFYTNPEKAIKHHEWLFDTRSTEYIKLRQYIFSVRQHSKLMSRKLKGIIKQSEKLKELIAREQKQ